MSYFLLMSHAVLGSLLGLAGVWLFVDVLNAKEENQARIRSMSLTYRHSDVADLSVGGIFLCRRLWCR